MANIRQLTEDNNQVFYPQTHEKAVVDSNGVTINMKIASKQDTISDLQTIRSGAAAGATAYQKPSGGVPKSDLASSVQTSISKADTAIQPAEFNELKEEVRTIGNGAYEEAWDGSSAPVVADIPAGVSVTYNSTSYTGTLAASASTVDKIYLVSDGNGNYDRYTTVEANGAYSWKKVGSTAIPLSNYSTKSEVSQLRQEVHTLSGKYYGVFASANDLPEGDGVGYAFVGENEPFAIWNFDGTSWSDSGSEAIGLQGPQGNSGYTGAVGELEVVNNLEDGGATAALSAEMGKLLSRNMKLLYDSMGAAAFWSDKPNIDWSGNGEPVSISLTKCSINNLASTVPLGEPYQATITPDAGAILETVSCVMNGETQTVTNGVIDIAEVTGAIIITAVAYDLDSVAYESLTYKQLFETNNVLGITAGFENGSYSPLTVKAGSPSITTEDKDSGTYSLKCSGTSSQQVRTSSAYTFAMLIACRCKVTSYTAGSCGIQSGGVDATLTEVSDWVTKTANRTSTASGAVFLGSLNSANLTGYVDTPVVVQKSIFTTAPSLSDFTALYNKYVALKKL